MKRGMKRAIAAGVVACMALTSLAGCSKKATFDTAAAILTVDGQEVPAGLVKFMTHFTQAASESLYTMYYGSGAFNMALDENGTTLGSLVRDGSVTEAKQLILAEQHAEEYGVELTEDEKAAITEAATAFMSANEEEVLEKMGATQETVERYLELYTIQNKMEPLMSADVDTEVSDEEAAQRKIQYVYFTASAETEAEETTEADTENVSEAAETEAETSVETEAAETAVETEAETAALTEEDTAKTQSADETETETAAAETEEIETETEDPETAAAETEEIETETEDPETAAAMAKALAKAEAVIANVKAGDTFEDAVTAVQEDKTALEMTFGSDDTTVFEGLITATEGLADGTLVEEPIKTDYGYYAVQVVSELDREATDAKKEEIVEERKSEMVSDLYTEWEEAVEITQDDKLIEKIVFDFSLTPATETETELTTEAAETELETASEAATEAESEADSEAVTEAETAAETEATTETETETE